MPRPLFTPKKDTVPIAQETGWAPGSVWTGAESLATPPGFHPRTVQPVASRYTDYATRPTVMERCLVEIPARTPDRNCDKCARLGRDMERIYIQSGPKKCIHSLFNNIFGINLNEISISG